MSKINQIQRALLELDGGAFQKLADAYISHKKVGPINSIGSVAGSNKARKGTPDSLVQTDDGNFIFFEHTTDQTSLASKIVGDLEKCLNEDKTGIPVSRIERIIFCFTGRLKPNEELEIVDLCKQKGVSVKLFSGEAISFDLYLKYPGIARNLLGVETDSGQIMSPDEFVRSYGKSKLAAPLDLDFRYRESELANGLESLRHQNLILLSGKPGVGKSRLALQVCEEFQRRNSEYVVKCIFGRNRDLWQDLADWFGDSGSYLILVDDANRVSRFDYIVELLMNFREDRVVKVVATVRDYAQKQVEESSAPLGVVPVIEVPLFSDKQIKGLIKEEYEILNHRYLERIADIAGGNPRLAVMAAIIAKNKNTLSSIHDVTSLYDSYFSGVRKELDSNTEINTGTLIKVAAIISFLKAVDRADEESMKDICGAFEISKNDFWGAAGELHNFEILDMYENEVVRVSDQVLGTYFFYVATFRENTLDFGMLLEHYYPKLQNRITDSVYSVLNAFDFDVIVGRLRPHFEALSRRYSDRGDEAGFLSFLEDFWFIDRTYTLMRIGQMIEALEQEDHAPEVVVLDEDNNNIRIEGILKVLAAFSRSAVEDASIALDLLCGYATKRPSEASKVLYVFRKDFGFLPESSDWGYEIQKVVVKSLESRFVESKFFACLFLALSKSYLQTHHETHKSKGRVVQFIRFDLLNSPQLVALRRRIIEGIVGLSQNGQLRGQILDLVDHYSRDYGKLTVGDIVKGDSELLLPFLVDYLNEDDFADCERMHSYFDTLERHNVDLPEGVLERFQNSILKLKRFLVHNLDEERKLGLNYSEYEEYRVQRLREHTSSYTYEDYNDFFDHLAVIWAHSDKEHDEYSLRASIEKVFEFLADRDFDLFESVLSRYLQLGNPYSLFPHKLVELLLVSMPPKDVFEFLKCHEFRHRERWLFAVYEGISGDLVNNDMLDELYALYESAQKQDLPHKFDYLIKFLEFDQKVFPSVVNILLARTREDPGVGHSLDLLFNPVTDIAPRTAELFSGEYHLLEEAYFVVDSTRNHSDYNGYYFNLLLDNMPSFATHYIEHKYKETKRSWVGRHDDHREYDVIWKRADFSRIVDQIVEAVFRNSNIHVSSLDPYLLSFFKTREVPSGSGEIETKQNGYLTDKIERSSQDRRFICFLFSMIANFEAGRRKIFIESLVKNNKDIDLFKELDLLPTSGHSWSGSIVPVLQKDIDYWKALLPIFRTVDLLPHRLYVEQQISLLHRRIENAKRSDFIDD